MPFPFSLISDRLDNMMAALQSFSHLSSEKHVDTMYCDQPLPARKFRHRGRAASASPERSVVLDALEPLSVAQHQWHGYSTAQSSLTNSGDASECSSLSATDHSTVVGSEGVCSPILPDKILPRIADFDPFDADTSYTEAASRTSTFEVDPADLFWSSRSIDIDEGKISEDPIVSYSSEATWPSYPTPLSPAPFRLRRPRSRIVMIPDDGPDDHPQRKRSNTLGSSPTRRFAGPPRFEL